MERERIDQELKNNWKGYYPYKKMKRKMYDFMYYFEKKNTLGEKYNLK